MTWGTVQGQVQSSPGFVANGPHCLSKQDILASASATGVDISLVPFLNDYSSFSLKILNLLLATQQALGQSITILLSTDGVTFSGGVSYQNAGFAQYATSAALTISGLANTSAFFLDAAATMVFQSATGTGVRGVNGNFDFQSAGASEMFNAKWELQGGGATNNFIRVGGSGVFATATGGVTTLRFNSNTAGVKIGRGSFELWGFKNLNPGPL